MGSNPTPRASLADSSANLIANNCQILIKELSPLRSDTLQETYNGSIDKLDERIDLITREASKPYFNKVLKKLARKNINNPTVICDYINAELTEINIKQSTMETKIKVLTWLSSFHLDKSFMEMAKWKIRIRIIHKSRFLSHIRLKIKNSLKNLRQT